MARPSKSIEKIENNYLKNFFLNKGFHSISNAAEELGIPYKTLARWCRNENLETFNYMLKLSAAFEDEPASIIKGISNGAST